MDSTWALAAGHWRVAPTVTDLNRLHAQTACADSTRKPRNLDNVERVIVFGHFEAIVRQSPPWLAAGAYPANPFCAVPNLGRTRSPKAIGSSNWESAAMIRVHSTLYKQDTGVLVANR